MKTKSLSFTGPEGNTKKLIRYAKELGFVDTTELYAWKEILPEISGPGPVLQGARTRLGMSQRKLSELTGIPQRHISEMENNKRPIGKRSAMKFAEALDIGYKVFLWQ